MLINPKNNSKDSLNGNVSKISKATLFILDSKIKYVEGFIAKIQRQNK